MKTSLLVVACLLLLSCRKISSTYVISVPDPSSEIPKADINKFVHEQLVQHNYFDWKMAGDTMVWSALIQADSVLSIGYQPEGFADLPAKIHTIDVKSAVWQEARTKVLAMVMANEGSAAIVFKEGVLPVINLKISHFATLKALRGSSLIRYAEPIGYGAYMDDLAVSDVQASSDILASGCGYNTPKTDLVAGADYTTLLPGAKASWNYGYHHIAEAWAKSSGQNVKVMLIDTGISDTQENLGLAFNQGYSSGRTIQKQVTISGGTVNDPCGHGTSMAGVIAAPRGTDGNAIGIAYNSNLLAVHAADNVVILSSAAINGVTNAYILGADDPAVKIISMSMGTIFSSGQIKDALNYAFNKQKLMFCAAGTSTPFFASFIGVIFPANQPQVVAITGIKDNLTERCADCHVGDKVDFVIVMEKTSTGRSPLSTAMSGDIPSTVGGSSVATASCSAIAALVWSKYPAYSRDSIMSRLVRSSSNAYNRSSKFGWGVINADAAVGS
ncbi:Serine protease, subtilisin family [Chitinophaga sp. YR573]|uniref:S8 family peptidase n=1 Tax=Chitinophaga sp. YR573 TaxID=1881040 RepID=UPI0008B77498|nr:S8 family serine peptidase [Chitinophaga sp. YR573]SEW39985.1 Serine protease, subtilisin family [Chitinophaga sp. YR573]